MLYLTMFASAFLAATLVPFASEITLAAALAAGGAIHWLIVTATLGNTLGAVVNWALGRFIEHFRDRAVVPRRPGADGTRAGVVPAIRSVVAAARLGRRSSAMR